MEYNGDWLNKTYYFIYEKNAKNAFAYQEVKYIEPANFTFPSFLALLDSKFELTLFHNFLVFCVTIRLKSNSLCQNNILQDLALWLDVCSIDQNS